MSGNKRKRNHYPRLPDAVLNLLALHSLRAVPMKEQEFGRGAALGWMYNVIPDRPATPADSNAKLDRLFVDGRVAGHPVIFKLRTNAPLEAWIKEVELSLKRKAGASLCYDFETDMAAVEKRMYDSFRYACTPCGKKP